MDFGGIINNFCALGDALVPSDIKLFHGDCMTYMKQMPDKAFDLAIVDKYPIFIYTMSIRKGGIYGN